MKIVNPPEMPEFFQIYLKDLSEEQSDELFYWLLTNKFQTVVDTMLVCVNPTLDGEQAD